MDSVIKQKLSSIHLHRITNYIREDLEPIKSFIKRISTHSEQIGSMKKELEIKRRYNESKFGNSFTTSSDSSHSMATYLVRRDARDEQSFSPQKSMPMHINELSNSKAAYPKTKYTDRGRTTHNKNRRPSVPKPNFKSTRRSQSRYRSGSRSCGCNSLYQTPESTPSSTRIFSPSTASPRCTYAQHKPKRHLNLSPAAAGCRLWTPPAFKKPNCQMYTQTSPCKPTKLNCRKCLKSKCQCDPGYITFRTPQRSRARTTSQGISSAKCQTLGSKEDADDITTTSSKVMTDSQSSTEELKGMLPYWLRSKVSLWRDRCSWRISRRPGVFDITLGILLGYALWVWLGFLAHRLYVVYRIYTGAHKRTTPIM